MGMATYIEPIARAQIGRMSAARVWGPQAGEQGLDRTALFAGWYAFRSAHAKGQPGVGMSATMEPQN
jgi:hypothetical protein